MFSKRTLKKVLPEPVANKLIALAKRIYPGRTALRYSRYYHRYRLNPHMVFYEAHGGAGMVCNPYALFLAFLQRPDFREYHHIWAIEDEEELLRLQAEYAAYPNVRFVRKNSKQYLRAITEAKYLINNTSFSSYFAKKPGQVFIDTWHSITVKTLGFDVPDGRISSGNMLRNLLMADYILSANRFTTKVFRESYKLDGLYEGMILETGHPRNDLVVGSARETVLRKLAARGVSVDPNKKIILYAPTWRGTSFSNPTVDIDKYTSFVETVMRRIDTAQYQILVKPHQAVYKHLSAEEKASGKYVPRSIDANALLSAVDLLVSDYSSIYFDFMLTDRPILFYIPDLERYNEYRGLYFTTDDLPGPATDSAEQIADWICSIGKVQADYRARYQETKAWACEFDDGQVSKRVLEVVFDGAAHGNQITDFRTPKKKVLFYAGALDVNGVTSSALSLLRKVDYEKFDFSMIVFNAQKKPVMESILKIDPHVRVFNRCGAAAATLSEDFRDQMVRKGGLCGWRKKVFPKSLYQREFVRCFGNVHFDYVVDFSGYGVFFPFLMMQAEGAKRMIWQHNDLYHDMQNADKRKLKNYRSNKISLEGLVSLYSYFDKVVSCSRSVMRLNRENLSTPETYAKFTYATNTMDPARILGAIGDPLLTLDGTDYIPIREPLGGGALKLTLYPDYQRQHLPDASDGAVFVTMGRLSPEKNHENLIRAFQRVCQTHPESRLYIIGDGMLRTRLRRLCDRLGLSDRVIFTGNLSNPFAIMRRCDCFVFPSRYEGQGLVVLEARILGLPILVSNFSVVEDVCVPDGQLVVGMEEDDLYDGLCAYFRGEVPRDYQFDVEKYNRKAYAEFEHLFLS